MIYTFFPNGHDGHDDNTMDQNHAPIAAGTTQPDQNEMPQLSSALFSSPSNDLLPDKTKRIRSSL